MSEEQNVSAKEIRQIVRLLERTRSLAQEATMTGSLKNGQSYAVQQYNAIVASLGERGVMLPQYFPDVAEDAGWGAVGFASAQLAEFLKDFLPPEDSAGGEGATGGEGSFFDRFFGSGEFQHIGEAMREAIPDWRREARRWRRGSPGAGGESQAASPGAAPAGEGGAPAGLANRLAGVSARIEAVAAQMRRPEITPDELQQLAAEMARLGEEQARIAREAAEPRSASTEP
jgi:hypothetical protein